MIKREKKHKKIKFSLDNLFMFIIIVLGILTLFNLVYTFGKLDTPKVFVGFITDEGYANLTIQSSVLLNFTNDSISWGSGYVPSGQNNCTLTTEGGNNCTDFINISNGLVLENIGNANVSVNLSADNNASGFIGGTGPVYQWKVTENESNSCSPATNITSYTDVTTTAQVACENFNYDVNDSLNVHLRIVIPSDAYGTKASIITATGTAIS